MSIQCMIIFYNNSRIIMKNAFLKNLYGVRIDTRIMANKGSN